MDKDGVSDFSALIKAVHKKSEAIAFVAFDLLHIDGIDLRKEPLIRRRDLLRELIPDDGSIQYSDHFVASGKEIFEAVKKLGLEGIVSKRAKAPYRSGPRATGSRPRTTPKSNCRSSASCRRPASRPWRCWAIKEDRTYVGSAAVVVNKLNRDLFWQAVEFLTDHDRKRADENMRWLKPGLVGRVRYLWGSSGLRHATVMSLGCVLAGRRTSLTAENVGMLSCGSQNHAFP